MLNKFIFLICCLATQLTATIIEIDQINQVEALVNKDAFVLFNVTEVLIDSPISLGSQGWRKYVRTKAPEVHDKLSLYVASHVPNKTVEPTTAQLVTNLQQQGIIVSAITGRGREEWYHTQMMGIDLFTEGQLKNVNIDLISSQPPLSMAHIQALAPHFHRGIFYCNHMDTGQFLVKLLQESDYHPSMIIYIDDKRKCLEPIEKTMKEAGIPFIGVVYKHAEERNKLFSPMIANVQLAALLADKGILTDTDAAEIIQKNYAETDPDQYFLEILSLSSWR